MFIYSNYNEDLNIPERLTFPISQVLLKNIPFGIYFVRYYMYNNNINNISQFARFKVDKHFYKKRKQM